ncbi:MAG: hypothetical protein KF884_06060 [Fimbriimonadaceae bacterium]|nr:hypothetical protein [Fimbriimonadaceae bacterium]QYK59649.1 MAG: hypothetical protein KF884_06060 [Fimbriimonadaceae bacterium]
MPQRSSDAKEVFVQRGLVAIVPGVIILVLAIVLMVYSETFRALAVVLMVIALSAIVYGIYEFNLTRGVTTFSVVCPFCQSSNSFTEEPRNDVRCEGCQRAIPILDGRVAQVFQVRCGFCNELNFYSEKSTGLICESCDHEIPIAVSEQVAAARATMDVYTAKEDDRPFDLILTGVGGPHNEALISTLQHMLALNRNQVKEIMQSTPSLLLSGIPKRKAEMLRTQIVQSKGSAEARPGSP